MSGAGRRLCITVGFILSIAALLGFGPTDAKAALGPYGTTVSTNQFLIVMDEQQDTGTIMTRLAEAGFASTEKITGLAPRFGNWRMVSVSSANDTTKAQLLDIDGILAVRPVYTAKEVDYPILNNGQIIARFQSATPASQVAAIASQANCTIDRQIDGLPQAYVFNVNESSQTAAQAAAIIAANSNVRWCKPSIMFKPKLSALDPIEDTLYPFQWHLKNTGQLEGGVPGADIDAETAWDVTMGAGAIVAIIDACLQRDHEDLAANYLTGYDFTLQTNDPSPMFGPYYPDEYGEAHGTCVAGIICGAANNIGVRGVAPEAKIIGCKIGFGPVYSTDQDIADAFLFAERNGAMAINNSWGGPGGAILPTIPNTFLLPDVITDAIDEVATNGRNGKGVLVLFSSGNESILLSFGNMYAAWPTVMAVGATLRDDKLTCYSNFGPEQSVVAPGGGFSISRGLYYSYGSSETCYDSDITTTDNMEVPGYWPRKVTDENGDTFYAPGYPIRGYNPPMRFLSVQDDSLCYNEYDLWCVPLVPDPEITDFPDENYTHHFNGTSAACPVATGVAALVFSANPNLTAIQARNIIEHTADKITSPNEDWDGVTGHNDHYGHGRVNAGRAAVAAAAGQIWPAPVENIQAVSSQSLIRIFWDNPEDDFAGVLVVRGHDGKLNWAPTDGIEYTVGQQVASGVIVVANSDISNLDQTGLSAGDYEYAVFARNEDNYYAWGRRSSFTSTGPVEVPLASMVASPKAGSAPLSVHFTGGTIDANIKTVTFSWDFGDGTVGAGAAIDHIYSTPGTYTARLTARNSSGQTATATAPITVSSGNNEVPVARIVANPTSGPVPLVVLFQAAATDEDGTIVSYRWDFGDGTSSSGQTVEHIYLLSGTYGVTLTVTDNLAATGTDVAIINVTQGSATAAETDPAGILDNSAATTACGSGTATAMTGTMAALLAFMFVRRRQQ